VYTFIFYAVAVGSSSSRMEFNALHGVQHMSTNEQN